MNILNYFDLIIAMTALVVSCVSLVFSIKSTKTDRKVNTYMEAITYLDKIAFRAESPELGFGDMLISDVTDDWVKEQVLIAIDIYSRLKLFDEDKADDFLKLVNKIYGSEHIWEEELYQKLRNEIIKEIN